jgi:ABC-2 type transport system permease protein
MVALGALTAFTTLLQFALMGLFLQQGNTFPGIAQYGGNILAFLITGSTFTAFVTVSLSVFTTFLREEHVAGTMETLLTTQTPLSEILAYAGALGIGKVFVNTVIILTVVTYLFGVPFSVNPLGALASIAGLVFALLGFGLTSAGIVLVTKRGDPVTWLLSALTALLSGVLYPIAILPAWAQAVAWVLPTTQALHAVRMAVTQAAGAFELGPLLLNLTLWGLVMLLVGLLVLRWGLLKARMHGSLAEF